MSVVANIYNRSTEEGRVVLSLAAQLADVVSGYIGEDAIVPLFIVRNSEFDRAKFIAVMADSVAGVLIASKESGITSIPSCRKDYLQVAERLAVKSGHYHNYELIDAISRQVEVIFDLVGALPEEDRLAIESFIVIVSKG